MIWSRLVKNTNMAKGWVQFDGAIYAQLEGY